jgi:outer membrane protein assembly factor BamB
MRIVPEDVNMIQGEHVFQLLNSHGAEIPADDWFVSDPNLAEIKMRDGRPVVVAKAGGNFTVTATVSGQSAIAHVNVLDSFEELQRHVHWFFSPFNGSFRNVLHAWAPDPDGANYFYEDSDSSHSLIRAIREDGIQLWAWPAAGSPEIPALICGNMANGVLLSLGKVTDRVLVMLDGNGKEMWRHAVPGFSSIKTFTLEGSLFIAEDNPAHTSSTVIGLDAATGAPLSSVDLPSSRQVLRNMVHSKNSFICSPGTEAAELLPIRHTRLETGIDGVAHLSFAVMDLVADAGNCAAGQPVATDAIMLKYSQKLQRLNLHADGAAAFDLLQTNSAEGPAAKTLVIVSTPTGDIIPDYNGDGNFIAVRQTSVYWPDMSSRAALEFEYRVSAEGELTDKFPMLPTLRERPTVMLLGDENKTGLTARGNTVLAFATTTGKMLWKWQARTETVRPLAALADGGVIIKDGPYYLILNQGGTVRTLLPPGFLEFYMHWNDVEDEL